VLGQAALGRKNGHPRMFGYVQSSGSFAGVAADLLASALNAFNRALMLEAQRDGDSSLPNAQIGAAFALRACIVNFRTRTSDARRLLATIRRVAARPEASV